MEAAMVRGILLDIGESCRKGRPCFAIWKTGVADRPTYRNWLDNTS